MLHSLEKGKLNILCIFQDFHEIPPPESTGFLISGGSYIYKDMNFLGSIAS